MVVRLTYFWAGGYGLSTVGVDIILGSGYGIQGQIYVALLQHYSRGVKQQQVFTTVVGLHV